MQPTSGAQLFTLVLLSGVVGDSVPGGATLLWKYTGFRFHGPASFPGH
jgi:hypothetical protein